MEDKEIVLRRAKNAVISRDFNLAIRLYKSLLQEDVKNKEYLLTLGNLYQKNNDDEKALPYYQQILTFYPDNFEAMNNMGGIFRRMGKYQESIDILQKALETGKDSAQVNYNLGFTYKLMKDYEDAIDCFENVIAQNSSDVLAYNHLGTIYATQQNYEKAVQTYKRGLQVDPNHPILQFNMAKSLEEMHDDSSAIQAYETALKAKPGWEEAVIAYSNLLLNHRKTKPAGELVQNAIGLHPKNASLYIQMGKILMKQCNFEKSVASFDIAQRLLPGNAENLKCLAQSYESLNKNDQAVKAIQDALKEEPQNVQVKKQAASVYLTFDYFAQAAKIIRELIETNKNDCSVLSLAGQYSIMTGKEEGAEKFAQRIKAIDSNYTDFLFSYAERFFQKGELEKAKAKVKEFIDENMKNVPAWILLGKIDEKSGNFEDALDDFSTASAFDPNNYLAEKLSKMLKEKIGTKPTEVGAEDKKESHELEGSQEISLDEFGLGDEEDETEENQNDSVQNENAENSANGSELDDLAEEDKTDVLAVDDETALFEDSSSNGEVTEETEDTEEDSEDSKDVKDDETKEENKAEAKTEPNSVLDTDTSTNASSNVNEAANAGEATTTGANADTNPNADMTAAANSNDVANEATNADAENPLTDESDVLPDTETLENGETAENTENAKDAVTVNADISTGASESSDSAKEQKNELEQEQTEAKNAEESHKEHAENTYENLVDKVSDMLPRLSNLIEDSADVEKFKKEIDLFKRLREFGEALPFEQRAKFLAGRIRLLLDYIISRLSGKPGLLKTASQFSTAENPSENKNCTPENIESIVGVLKHLEGLTLYLEDKNLSKALFMAAEEVVDKLC